MLHVWPKSHTHNHKMISGRQVIHMPKSIKDIEFNKANSFLLVGWLVGEGMGVQEIYKLV